MKDNLSEFTRLTGESAAKPDALKALGARLRAARESKGMSLDQARIKTRIYSKVLSALEEGTIDEMFNLTYSKGFLKKYASFLGLNADEIVKEYLAVHSEPKEDRFPQVAPLGTAGPRVRVRRIPPFPFTPLVTLAVSAVLVFSLVLFLKAQKPTFKPRGKAAKVTAPAVSAKQPAKARTAPIPSKSAVVSKRPVPPPKAKEPAMPLVSISKNEPLVLTFGVRRPVYVQVSRDGVVLFERLLRERTVETVKAQERLNLRVADIEALELYLNGKPLSIPRKGEIKDLEITRRGIKIR
jgi:cytoskeletal protein RodZ